MATVATGASLGDKKVSETHSSDNSSQDTPKSIPEHGSHENHPFRDEATAAHWLEIYKTANYEGLHRFDPEYTWTAAEEKKLVRKVSQMSSGPDSTLTMEARLENHVMGLDHVHFS